MKTTLNIDDQVMRGLRREAARHGKTMSELVETALRRLLVTRQEREPLPPLPTFSAGRPAVDLTSREALHAFLEER